MKKTVNISEWDKLTKKQKKAVTKIEFTGTKKISDVKHRPTMAFATMCKNEEHCIGKTLNAVADYVDYVTVADNGSTDETFNIVREYFNKTGLPGAWHIDDWNGFDKNKTLMMSYVKDKTDYVLHLDADDFLVGQLEFYFQNTGSDQYLILNKRGALRYWCSIIYDNSLTWRFLGVAHTVIKCEERPVVSQEALSEDMVFIDNSGEGARILDPNKFLGDALRLSKQYEDTLIDDTDGLNTRSVFYCAQSYKDQGGKYDVDSLKWYKKYMTLRNTWFEEEYECQLSIAQLKLRLNNSPELGYTFSREDLEQEYLKAIKIINDRAEAFLGLGALYNREGEHQQAYDILKEGKLISLEKALEKYNLFVVETCYGLAFNDELSVACYHLGKKKEGIDLIKEVKDHPDHIHLKKHYEANLIHLDKLK
tara:strand:- start:9 stop:1274 length:1266 start_codon:yes stop_codon:yes gene_type:complete